MYNKSSKIHKKILTRSVRQLRNTKALITKRKMQTFILILIEKNTTNELM